MVKKKEISFQKGGKKINVRGKTIEGVIVRMKSKKTAHIETKTIKFIPKYERYLVNKSVYPVHVPDGLDVAVGDTVLCGETRKLSKTKSFIILEKINSNNNASKESEWKWNKLVLM